MGSATRACGETTGDTEVEKADLVDRDARKWYFFSNIWLKMGRRKQIVPKKSDNLEDQDPSKVTKNDEEAGTVESDAGSESNDEQEVTMPMLESLEPHRPSSNSPPAVTPTPKSPSADKMQGTPSPMDLMKNPFLLPAHLLALNPNLYAAQLAQLQAAQLLLSKQQNEGDRNGQSLADRKRSIEEDSPLDLGSKAKYPRSSSPIDGRTEPTSESPLDLSGNKSPEVKRELNSFNPLLPPNILSFFNQMKHGGQNHDFPGLMGFHGQKHSPPSPPSRNNPWQSQWISKNSEGTRIEDVFKCVWCKESYQTLEALTTHMKEAKHHSMPYPLPSSVSHRPGPPSVSSPLRTSVSMSSPVSSLSSSPKPNPPRDILKEQLPLPRKLVRGQDVWIGRADQQTRDILKCMGCGSSFRSLDLLTKHMQETQHYKKVISHDQISAWKYPESQQTAKNHVNSVLTCKVCDKGFGSLKELSDHMVKANHYTPDSKVTRNPQTPPSSAAKDRKKALPVKKLLELERARHEVMGGATGSKSANSARDIMESGKLLCERCEDKIPLDFFIAHIQQCVGKPRFIPSPLIKVEGDSSKESSDKSSENDKKTDGHASILGSLEQLVKGNFQNSASKRQQMSSPPTSILNPAPSVGKFSIQSMFPKDSPVSPSSSNSVSSKPASPTSSRPSSAGHTSLEKMLDSPIEQTNGKIKEENDYSNQRDATPSPSNSSHYGSGSPKANDSSKDNIDSHHDESLEGKHNDKNDTSPPAKLSPGDKEKKSENPLAALQMLCDTQKKTPKTPKITENSMSDPGAMLAFSWACNQAVSNDSVIKCPFCDTPFISKGAYRHHLSKMHFTKESTATGPSHTGLPANVRTPSPEAKEDETLQSKYHKYAQLAKQLSCNHK